MVVHEAESRNVTSRIVTSLAAHDAQQHRPKAPALALETLGGGDGLAVAVERALAFDRDVLRVDDGDERGADVGAEAVLERVEVLVLREVGRAEDLGALVEVERDVVLEDDRAGEVRARRDGDLPAAVGARTSSIAFWIAAVSSVLPSPVAPKSLTLTSFARATASSAAAG